MNEYSFIKILSEYIGIKSVEVANLIGLFPGKKKRPCVSKNTGPEEV
jgi:hypothetical protein